MAEGEKIIEGQNFYVVYTEDKVFFLCYDDSSNGLTYILEGDGWLPILNDEMAEIVSGQIDYVKKEFLQVWVDYLNSDTKMTQEIVDQYSVPWMG
jgi:hypothetical protein